MDGWVDYTAQYCEEIFVKEAVEIFDWLIDSIIDPLLCIFC